MTQRRRIRAKYQDADIPAWLLDFCHGPRYRFIRPAAAAEIIGIESEAAERFMRQPDPEEVEAIKPKKPLKEPEQWTITRVTIKQSTFGR